jgi:hypothetical protein
MDPWNVIKMYVFKYVCREQMTVVFFTFLLIARRWRNPTSSNIDIPDILFFKYLKYFEPGAIYRKHKAHSLTNKFRKSMFVLFLLNVYDQCHDVQNERMRVLILHVKVLCSILQIICCKRWQTNQY